MSDINQYLEVRDAVFYREGSELYVTHKEYGFEKELVVHINIGYLRPDITAVPVRFINSWDVLYGVKLVQEYIVLESYLVQRKDIDRFFKGYENKFVYARCREEV